MNENTVCKNCIGERSKWYPIPVSTLEEILSRLLEPHRDIKSIKALRKNIAYNLQYLEFQMKIQGDIDVTDVVSNQNYKMTIIVGMSIVEALLHYLLISKGKHKKTKWEEKPIVRIENSKTINNKTFLIQNIIFSESIERLERMSLKNMIEVAKQNELFGPKKSSIYIKLGYLVKLRNKIHLFISSTDTDTDYMRINKPDLDLMKLILLFIFTGRSLFKLTADEKELFDYLK